MGARGDLVRLFIARADVTVRGGAGMGEQERSSEQTRREGENQRDINDLHAYTYTYTRVYTGDKGK